MASSYSTDLKLELMATGENAGTWGINTNNNLNLIQQAIAGYQSIALTDGGTVALTMSNAALSNARNMVLKFTGTLTTASTVTIPDGIEKFYIIDLSAVVGVTNLTIKTATGTGFTAGEAAIVAAYSDGTNLNEIALNTLGGTIGSAQIDDNAITAAKISNNAVTTDKILASNVTTAKLAASAVTGNNIAQSTITQAKLATDSVGSTQLIATGVTAQEYTVATITVDADGRITAASSGTAGGNNMYPKVFNVGPSSSSFTTGSGATKYQAYAWGGGGGGSGRINNLGGVPGSKGGSGGFGFYSGPISASTPYSYTVGAPGSGGPTDNQAGSAGGSTSVTGLFTVNGGQGGQVSQNSPPPPGNPGNAPGATIGNFNSQILFRDAGTGGNGAVIQGYNGNPGVGGGLYFTTNEQA